LSFSGSSLLRGSMRRPWVSFASIRNQLVITEKAQATWLTRIFRTAMMFTIKLQHIAKVGKRHTLNSYRQERRRCASLGLCVIWRLWHSIYGRGRGDRLQNALLAHMLWEENSTYLMGVSWGSFRLWLSGHVVALRCIRTKSKRLWTRMVVSLLQISTTVDDC